LKPDRPHRTGRSMRPVVVTDGPGWSRAFPGQVSVLESHLFSDAWCTSGPAAFRVMSWPQPSHQGRGVAKLPGCVLRGAISSRFLPECRRAVFRERSVSAQLSEYMLSCRLVWAVARFAFDSAETWGHDQHGSSGPRSERSGGRISSLAGSACQRRILVHRGMMCAGW